MPVEMTRAKLDGYRKLAWVLIMSDTIGGKNLCSGRKRKPEQSVNGSRQ